MGDGGFVALDADGVVGDHNFADESLNICSGELAIAGIPERRFDGFPEFLDALGALEFERAVAFGFKMRCLAGQVFMFLLQAFDVILECESAPKIGPCHNGHNRLAWLNFYRNARGSPSAPIVPPIVQNCLLESFA